MEKNFVSLSATHGNNNVSEVSEDGRSVSSTTKQINLDTEEMRIKEFKNKNEKKFALTSSTESVRIKEFKNENEEKPTIPCSAIYFTTRQTNLGCSCEEIYVCADKLEQRNKTLKPDSSMTLKKTQNNDDFSDLDLFADKILSNSGTAQSFVKDTDYKKSTTFGFCKSIVVEKFGYTEPVSLLKDDYALDACVPDFDIGLSQCEASAEVSVTDNSTSANQEKNVNPSVAASTPFEKFYSLTDEDDFFKELGLYERFRLDNDEAVLKPLEVSLKTSSMNPCVEAPDQCVESCVENQKETKTPNHEKQKQTPTNQIVGASALTNQNIVETTLADDIVRASALTNQNNGETTLANQIPSCASPCFHASDDTDSFSYSPLRSSQLSVRESPCKDQRVPSLFEDFSSVTDDEALLFHVCSPVKPTSSLMTLRLLSDDVELGEISQDLGKKYNSASPVAQLSDDVTSASSKSVNVRNNDVRAAFFPIVSKSVFSNRKFADQAHKPLLPDQTNLSAEWSEKGMDKKKSLDFSSRQFCSSASVDLNRNAVAGDQDEVVAHETGHPDIRSLALASGRLEHCLIKENTHCGLHEKPQGGKSIVSKSASIKLSDEESITRMGGILSRQAMTHQTGGHLRSRLLTPLANPLQFHCDVIPRVRQQLVNSNSSNANEWSKFCVGNPGMDQYCLLSSRLVTSLPPPTSQPENNHAPTVSTFHKVPQLIAKQSSRKNSNLNFNLEGGDSAWSIGFGNDSHQSRSSKWSKYLDGDHYVPNRKKQRQRWLEEMVEREKESQSRAFYTDNNILKTPDLRSQANPPSNMWSTF